MEYLNKRGELFHKNDNDKNDELFAFKVDELMVPILSELNRKNYTTSYSCSSHFSVKHRNAYIAFEPWIRIPSIPKGWKYEEDFNLIRFYPADTYDKENMDNYYPYYLYLLTIFYETHKWAKSLPEFHPGKEERELKAFFINIIKDKTLERYIFKYMEENDIPGIRYIDTYLNLRSFVDDWNTNRRSAVPNISSCSIDDMKKCVYTKFKNMNRKQTNYFMDSYEVVLKCLAKNFVEGQFNDYNDVVDYLERL